MQLTQSDLFSGGLMLISKVPFFFLEGQQANHTVLLSNISHIDHQASYTPDTLQYIK